MINLTQALQIAKTELEKIQNKSTIKVALMEECTRDFKFGWFFFINQQNL